MLIMETLRQFVADSPFATATWIDIVDIVILSLYFTEDYSFEGTRALQSLLGSLVLGIAFVLSDILELNCTGY